MKYLQITGESSEDGRLRLSAGLQSMTVDVHVLGNSWPGRMILIQYRATYALQLLKWLSQDIIGRRNDPNVEERSDENFVETPSLSITGRVPGPFGSRDPWRVQLHGGRESMWVPLETLQASWAGRMLPWAHGL